MNLDKVYVITDNCVWDDEDYSQIVGIATTKELATEYFKNYVKRVKEDLDFENLDIVKDPMSEDCGYVVDDEDNYFRVYKNGEYNSYHTYISLYEKELIKESEMEL